MLQLPKTRTKYSYIDRCGRIKQRTQMILGIWAVSSQKFISNFSLSFVTRRPDFASLISPHRSKTKSSVKPNAASSDESTIQKCYVDEDKESCFFGVPKASAKSCVLVLFCPSSHMFVAAKQNGYLTPQS